MDGVAITDEHFNNMVIAPSIEAIEEINIQKTSYAPEFGGKSGAVVNVVSRSGSNDPHGSLFEFVRNDAGLTVMPWGVPLMVWGYLQYRLVGSFRWRHGGGGPSVDVLPQRIVTEGPYALTRNPMYLGHLIYMAGLALTFWSWLGLAILLVNLVWFQFRVRNDERNLLKQFGAPYADYCGRVKRWIPGVI